MTDALKTTPDTTDTFDANADALWNSIRLTVVPLAELIVEKRKQFQGAASSQTLAEIYKVDALKQVERLSEAENCLMRGLQLFKQALYIKYVRPENEAPQVEFFLARLNETLIN